MTYILQINATDADNDQLIYELVQPTSNLARTHFLVGTDQTGSGKAFVGASLTQTNTSRFTLFIVAKDISSRPQSSNTVKVKSRSA